VESSRYPMRWRLVRWPCGGLQGRRGERIPALTTLRRPARLWDVETEHVLDIRCTWHSQTRRHILVSYHKVSQMI